MSPANPTTHDDVYRKLQERIDELPVPFPSTASGVELRLLKALFDEREAHRCRVRRDRERFSGLRR